MIISQWLAHGQQALAKDSGHTARLDCLVLLEDATGRNRAWLLAHPEAELAAGQLITLGAQLEQRAAHEPLAYIRGQSEFYGRPFYVNQHVLVPRPESETIITLLLTTVASKIALKKLSIADIGTGSGALAITAQLETGAVAAAVDIDEACLDVVRRNAVLHTTEISCFKGDLLAPFWQKNNNFGVPDILLCNLPYVPTDYPINQAAAHEPALALFGGNDGLDLYRRLFTQTTQLPKKPQFILTESLPQQHTELAAIATKRGYRQHAEADFVQLFVPSS